MPRVNRPAYTPERRLQRFDADGRIGKKLQTIYLSTHLSALIFLQGAAFEESPLVKTKTSWMGGFSVTWVFSEIGKDGS